MQFLSHGPDIPVELIAAQEKVQTIFVCGTGVFCTAGLPLFRSFVEGVYQQLSEDWTLHIAEHEGMRSRYYVRQRIRKRIEEVFGWTKTVAGQSMTQFRGLPRGRWAFTFAMAAYNLIRLPKLLVD